VPVAYSMKEPEHHKDVSGEESKAMKAVVKDVFQRKDLRNIVLYGAFIYAALQTAFWFYQPYFELTGLDIATFGFIFAGFNVVSAASSRYADFIEDQLGRKLSLVMLLVLVVVSLSLMSSFVMAFSFVFIFLQQFVRGFSKPIISDYINQLIDSENRSTILSTHSLIGRAIQAATLPLFGVISDIYTITWALSILGLTVFFAGTVLLSIMYLEDLTYLELSN
jgi:sugar phosphate permease